MKKVLLPLVLAVLGCSFPVQVTVGLPTPTLPPEPISTPAQTPLSADASSPQGEPGAERNPLILALSPAPRPAAEVIEAGEFIAQFIQTRTGYRVVTVAPVSEARLVEALSKGNAHIVSLSPYAYALAQENNLAAPLLARVRNGEAFYGAQFVAHRGKAFTSFYDDVRGENTASPQAALRQFQDKKACWSDTASPSGYVVPLGLLKQAGVRVRSEAFLAGHPNVVRAVYAEDICDFGATFVDARNSSVLEADYPDVIEKVMVVWRIPKIIPYENISIAAALPFEMRRVIQRAFIDLMLTPEGKSAMQRVYGFDAVQVIEEAAYAEFLALVRASGLDLGTLIK